MRMRLFTDWLHGLLTVVLAGVLWVGFITSVYDIFPAVALLVVGYALAGFVHPHVKKYLFPKTVLFDIHGVYLGGDLNMDTLYEMEGTWDLMQRLRQKYKLAAVTNMGPEMMQVWASKWRFGQTYDYFFYSGGLKVKKPDPKIFEIVLKQTHSTASNTVFLDDVAENVEAAKKLGIRGIVFKSAKQAEEDLKKIGFGP